MKGRSDSEVIDKAEWLTATIVTNDAGLAKRFRELPERKKHGECCYGLLLITAPTEEGQARLLKRHASTFVWNEVAEQDIYVHIQANGKITMKSLCEHTNYERRAALRKRKAER